MNKRSIFAILAVFVVLIGFVWSCGKEDIVVEPPVVFGNAIELSPINLPSMNGEMCYELWLVNFNYTMDSDSNAIRIVEEELSLGRFYWDNYRYEFYKTNGRLRDNVFETDGRNVYDFNAIMITIEPLDDDGVRANNGLIYDDVEFGQPIHGEFNFFGMASPEVVMDLEDPMTADYVLRTYSDDGNPTTNMASGLWFHAIVPTEGGQVWTPTLNIPAFTHKANFTYEGWVNIPSVFPRPLSTGKFKKPYFADMSNPYVGTLPFRNVPGEDFLNNPPSGFEDLFPLQLLGVGEAYITIEPYPDPYPLDPFPLRIFQHSLPVDSSSMDNTFEMTSLYDFLPEFDAEVMEL